LGVVPVDSPEGRAGASGAIEEFCALDEFLFGLCEF
jgi:hypothetical protein